MRHISTIIPYTDQFNNLPIEKNDNHNAREIIQITYMLIDSLNQPSCDWHFL